MNRFLTHFGQFCFHFVLFALLILAVPCFYLYMLWDFKRLKRTALELEPFEEPSHRGLRLVSNVLMIVFLPIIVLIGGFQCLFFPKDDEDDIIW